MKRIRIILIAGQFLIIAWLLSCKKDEPLQPHVPSIQLSVEDVSCTEAWLKVSLTDSAEPRTIAIVQDGQRVSVSSLRSPDSVFVIEGLLPRHPYSFIAQRLQRDSTVIGASTSVQATTMDTTSHSFTWQIDTLGVTASTLYDVAIINDTLAYAVGEMYLRDSIGQIDPQAYNMAEWNGRGWQLMRIQFYTICGQTSRTPYPASSVFAFGATDVWITSRGGQLARWNGTTQTATICNPDPFVINKIWGENPNSIWAVGYGGRIGYYSNGTWQRVGSGTTLSIHDVFGQPIAGARMNEIICVASNHSFPEGRKLLRLEGATVTALSDTGLPWSIDAIWHVPRHKYYVVGDGVYSVNRPGSVWTRNFGLPNLYTTSVQGTALNDIVIGGAFWNLLHFNGLTWHSYFPFSPGSFTSVAIKGNTIIAVGGIGNRAIAVRGTR